MTMNHSEAFAIVESALALLFPNMPDEVSEGISYTETQYFDGKPTLFIFPTGTEHVPLLKKHFQDVTLSMGGREHHVAFIVSEPGGMH